MSQGQNAMLAAMTKKVDALDKHDQENADKLLKLQQEEREIDAATVERKEAYEAIQAEWYERFKTPFIS